MSANEVNGAIAAQVANGHVLDQTVWNYHFEYGTDRLNAMGLDHLAMLARRRPQADPLLFLQTAEGDVDLRCGGPGKAESSSGQDLNAKRIAAVQKFMLAQTAGKGYDFQVAVIDPSEIGLAAIPVNLTNTQIVNQRLQGPSDRRRRRRVRRRRWRACWRPRAAAVTAARAVRRRPCECRPAEPRQLSSARRRSVQSRRGIAAREAMTLAKPEAEYPEFDSRHSTVF